MSLHVHEKEALLLELERYVSENWISEEIPLTISFLHGFLCAVHSMPNFLPDELWHELILFPNMDFESDDEAIIFLRLLATFSEEVKTCLVTDHHFNPIFYQDGTHHATEELIEEWCIGYISAINLDPVWRDSEPAHELIVPIVILSSMLEKIDEESEVVSGMDDIKAEYFKTLPVVIKTIFDYWRKYQEEHKCRELTLEDIEPFLEQ